MKFKADLKLTMITNLAEVQRRLKDTIFEEEETVEFIGNPNDAYAWELVATGPSHDTQDALDGELGALCDEGLIEEWFWQKEE